MRFGSCFSLNLGVDVGGYEVKSGVYCKKTWTYGVPICAVESGEQGAVTMMFTSAEKDWTPLMNDRVGLRLLISSPMEMPYPEDKGIALSFGTNTLVEISQSQFRNIKKCATYEDVLARNGTTYASRDYGVPYDKRSCQLTCAQTEMFKACNCRLPKTLSVNGMPGWPKGWEQLPVCADTYSRCNHSHIKDTCTSQATCPSPCYHRQFKPTISVSSWPAPDQKFLDDLTSGLVKNLQIYQNETHDERLYHLQKSAVQISIYFDGPHVLSSIEEFTYKVNDFFSDVGGLLGLFTGMSIMTLCEMIEFVIKVCFKK